MKKVKPKSPLNPIMRRGVLLDLTKKGITPELSQKALEAYIEGFERNPIRNSKLVDRRIAGLGRISLEKRKQAYGLTHAKEKIGFIKRLYPIRNDEGLIVRLEADVVIYKHRLIAMGYTQTSRLFVKPRRVETKTYRDTVILNEVIGFDFYLKKGRNKCT